jgi:hypothetical protein
VDAGAVTVNKDLSSSITPSECSNMTRQSEMTKAKIIVLRLSALFTIVIKRSAPGSADRSSLPSVLFVLRSLLV